MSTTIIVHDSKEPQVLTHAKGEMVVEVINKYQDYSIIHYGKRRVTHTRQYPSGFREVTRG